MFDTTKLFKNAAHGGHAGGPEIEPDDTGSSSKTIIRFGLALGVFLFACWYLGEQLLYYAANRIEAEDLAQRDSLLVERRAQEDALLEDYDLIDKDKGAYKIPIQQAMELIVKRNSVEPVTGAK